MTQVPEELAPKRYGRGLQKPAVLPSRGPRIPQAGRSGEGQRYRTIRGTVARQGAKGRERIRVENMADKYEGYLWQTRDKQQPLEELIDTVTAALSSVVRRWATLPRPERTILP